MARYAIINEQGLITNVVEWGDDSEWDPPAGFTAVENDEYSPGGTLIDGVYVPPEIDEGES